MSRDPLERRYRRLLRAYPRAWRERRDDEIVTVLLDAAPGDQGRPSVRDALDLVRSGVTSACAQPGPIPPGGGLGPRVRPPLWALSGALRGSARRPSCLVTRASQCT